MDYQVILNSTIFVFIAVRYAESMMQSSRRWLLVCFITAVFLANSGLMLGRFGLLDVFYRASMISAGFLVGVLWLNWNNRRYREKHDNCK